MKTIAIVLAGGRGSRMKSSTPKQYMLINQKPVIYYALRAFEDSPVDEIILVAGENDLSYCREEIVKRFGFKKVVRVVAGGKERYHSVMNGLQAIEQREAEAYVLIHDGARPCVSQEIIARCIDDVLQYHACVAAVPAKDTIKIADADGFAELTPDRGRVWQIQTPQVFDLLLVKNAYTQMLSDERRGTITDDAMVVEQYTDTKVKLTMGAYENIKITTPEDIVLAQRLLQQMPK